MPASKAPRPPARIAEAGPLEIALVSALAEGDGSFVPLRPMYVDIASGGPDNRPDLAAGLLLGLIVGCYTPAAGSGDGIIWARIYLQGHLWVALSKEYIHGRTRLSEEQVTRATGVLRDRDLVATVLRRFGKGPRTHYRLTETFLERREAWLAERAQALGYGARRGDEGANPDAARYPGKPGDEALVIRETRKTTPSLSGKPGEREPRYPGNPENFMRLSFLMSLDDSGEEEAAALKTGEGQEWPPDWPDPLKAWRSVVEDAADLSNQRGGNFVYVAQAAAQAEWRRAEDGRPVLRVVLGKAASAHWLSRAERALRQAWPRDFHGEIWAEK